MYMKKSMTGRCWETRLLTMGVLVTTDQTKRQQRQHGDALIGDGPWSHEEEAEACRRKLQVLEEASAHEEDMPRVAGLPTKVDGGEGKDPHAREELGLSPAMASAKCGQPTWSWC